MIVDSHAHLETAIPGVFTNPDRTSQTYLLMWSYEILGFRNPLWRGSPPAPGRVVIALENQLRLSMGCKKNLLAYMDKNGIDRSVVLPIAPFSTSRQYLESCRGSDRLIPFASVSREGDWESDLKYAMEAGCRGLKIHPILQKTPPEDSFYFDLLEAFRPYGRPVLAHTGEFDYFIPKDPCAVYGDTGRFERLVSAFPDVPFILGHMGLYYPEQALDLASRYESIYLETSFQSITTVRKAVSVAGRDRVMFGSDWPESNQKYALRIARRASSGDDDLRDKLLGGNILALVS